MRISGGLGGWTPPRRWARRSAAVAAGGMLLAAGPVALPAWADQPPPVTAISLSSRDAAVVDAGWTAPAGVASVDVCWAAGPAPATPTDSGATCSGSLPAVDQHGSSYYEYSGVAGTTYGVSVFSYDAGTGEYGTPVSGTVTAQDPPPLAPGAGTTQHGADELYVSWWNPMQTSDVRDYLVAWQRGLGVPGTDNAVVSTGSHVVIKLPRGVPYTIAVRARDHAGQLSAPSTVTATTRVPGLWLSDNNRRSGAIASTDRFDSAISTDATAAFAPTGAVVASYGNEDVTGGEPPTPPGYRLDGTDGHLVTHTPGTGWSSVVNDASPAVAYASGRWVAVSGHFNGDMTYRTRTTGGWSRPHDIAGTRGAGPVAVAVDREHRVHIVASSGPSQRPGLYYTTVSGTRVTHTLMYAGLADSARLAWDPTTDRIAVGIHTFRNDTDQIRVKVIRASATKVGSFTTWHSEQEPTGYTTAATQLTGLSTYGGQIAVAIHRQNSTPTGSLRNYGPYLALGTATTHRPFARVAGTGPADADLTVWMRDAHHVVLSWRRHDTQWRTTRLGIWVTTASINSGKPSFSRQRQWTHSPYDVPLAAATDTHRHTFVVYVKSWSDVAQCSTCYQ